MKVLYERTVDYEEYQYTNNTKALINKIKAENQELLLKIENTKKELKDKDEEILSKIEDINKNLEEIIWKDFV